MAITIARKYLNCNYIPLSFINNIKEIPFLEIQTLFNESCKNFSPVINILGKRKTCVEQNWQLYPSLDTFKTVFSKVSENDFFCGNNNYNWVASFDWIMKGDNMTKILEGFYDRENKAIKRENVSYNLDEYEKLSIFDFD